MWTKLSADKKSELMKAYKKGGFSYKDMIDDYNNSYEEFEKGGKVEFNSGGETHVVYKKESPTGNGKGIEGHIMINHPTKDKGKWDTIDLTDISNYKVKTIDQGIASTKKWHAENPEYKMGGMIKRADGSYSKRGLWDNIRANAGSGKAPTADMLEQERRIKNKYEEGGIEESINKNLGNPMLKAEIDSDYKRPTVDPRTRRQKTSEPVDNVRHAAAGRYTQEAIENYANLIPYASAIPGFSKAAGFIGSNVLGLGHEASTLFNKNDDDTRTMGMKVKESAADAYNNMIGSVIGASNLTPYQKKAYMRYLSETGKMPTGQYNKKKDPTYKKEMGGIQRFDEGGETKPPRINMSLMGTPNFASETTQSQVVYKEDPFKKAEIQKAADERNRLAYIEQQKQKKSNEDRVRARISAQQELDRKNNVHGTELYNEDFLVNRDIARKEYQNKINSTTNQMMSEIALAALPVGEIAQGVKFLGNAASKEASFLANRWGNMAGNAVNASKESGVLSNAYKLNPFATKEAQEAMLVRARPVGQNPYMNMAETLKAKEAAGEQLKWYQKNLLNPQTNPDILAREKYHGQWFADNPSDLDFYINPATRNFADDDIIEILKARMPKSEAAKYNVKNFEDAKTISNLHDTEYILPKDMVQQVERYSVDDLPKLVEEYNQINKPHWLKGYKEVPKELPGSPNVDFSKYLTQEEAVAARAERMLSQENKWVDQPSTLKGKFETAVENHNPASDYSPEKLGNNTGISTQISKLANLSDANKSRVAAHETGHYYRPKIEEGDVWNSFFDWSKLKGKTAESTARDIRKSKQYLSGKGYFKRNSSQYGDEIRERAAQLKDYIAQKNGIPLSKDFTVTQIQLDDAIKNYVKDTGLDNNMSQMLGALTDKKGFLGAMNKYALGTIPAVIGAGALQQEKNKTNK